MNNDNFESFVKASNEDQLNRFKKLVDKNFILKRARPGDYIEIISVRNVYRINESSPNIAVTFDQLSFLKNGPIQEIKQVKGLIEYAVEVHNLSFIFPIDGWEKKEVDYFVAQNYIDIVEDVCLNGLRAGD